MFKHYTTVLGNNILLPNFKSDTRNFKNVEIIKHVHYFQNSLTSNQL